jgi:hypothetical protein
VNSVQITLFVNDAMDVFASKLPTDSVIVQLSDTPQYVLLRLPDPDALIALGGKLERLGREMAGTPQKDQVTP